MTQIERWIFGQDYTPERTWSLVDAMRELGATEFTLHFVEFVDREPKVAQEGSRLLAPFKIGNVVREHMTTWENHPFVRGTQLWSLEAASMRALRALLPDGLFTAATPVMDGWAEDPVFYRTGELVLGVVSHENQGIIRLKQDEIERLAGLGFMTRARPNEPWRPWNMRSSPAS